MCDHKRIKFQHVQPQVKSDINPQDAPHLAGNNNEPMVIQPDDVGQQNDAPDGHMQPPIHSENMAGNDVQQPINNEDVSILVM